MTTKQIVCVSQIVSQIVCVLQIVCMSHCQLCIGELICKRNRPSILAIQDLDAVLPLAVFLAYERNKGQDSFWQPYLGLLPEQPGCAWLMAPPQLSEALKTVKQLVGKVSQLKLVCSQCPVLHHVLIV